MQVKGVSRLNWNKGVPLFYDWVPRLNQWFQTEKHMTESLLLAWLPNPSVPASVALVDGEDLLCHIDNASVSHWTRFHSAVTVAVSNQYYFSVGDSINSKKIWITIETEQKPYPPEHLSHQSPTTELIKTLIAQETGLTRANDMKPLMGLMLALLTIDSIITAIPCEEFREVRATKFGYEGIDKAGVRQDCDEPSHGGGGTMPPSTVCPCDCVSYQLAEDQCEGRQGDCWVMQKLWCPPGTYLCCCWSAFNDQVLSPECVVLSHYSPSMLWVILRLHEVLSSPAFEHYSMQLLLCQEFGIWNLCEELATHEWWI